MNHTVIEFCQFGLIPTVGGTYEITGDALESVDIVATAIGTLVHYLLGIFISAIHATVACVVYRAITDIELVHHVHDVHNSLGVVCSIAVYLHVEDVASACQVMVWTFHFGFVAGTASGNVLRLAPPLVISHEEMDAFVAALAEELTAKHITNAKSHMLESMKQK